MTGITFNPQSLSWLSIYALHWAAHVCLTCPRSSFGVSHIVTSPDIWVLSSAPSLSLSSMPCDLWVLFSPESFNLFFWDGTILTA